MSSITRNDSDYYRNDRDSEVERIDTFLASMHENHKGNLVTEYDGKTVTIFLNRWEKYQWSVADDDTVKFSKRNFPDQQSAAAALLDVLEEEVD